MVHKDEFHAKVGTLMKIITEMLLNFIEMVDRNILISRLASSD